MAGTGTGGLCNIAIDQFAFYMRFEIFIRKIPYIKKIELQNLRIQREVLSSKILITNITAIVTNFHAITQARNKASLDTVLPNKQLHNGCSLSCKFIRCITQSW